MSLPPLDVFSVASVVGHVEDKVGRLSAEEFCMDDDCSGELPSLYGCSPITAAPIWCGEMLLVVWSCEQR